MTSPAFRINENGDEVVYEIVVCDGGRRCTCTDNTLLPFYHMGPLPVAVRALPLPYPPSP